MRRMTFGTLPEVEEFNEAFDKACVGGDYEIEAKGVVAGFIDSGNYSADRLWAELHRLRKIHEDGPDENWTAEECEEAGRLASDIMGTLGFEWV